MDLKQFFVRSLFQDSHPESSLDGWMAGLSPGWVVCVVLLTVNTAREYSSSCHCCKLSLLQAVTASCQHCKRVQFKLLSSSPPLPPALPEGGCETAGQDDPQQLDHRQDPACDRTSVMSP